MSSRVIAITKPVVKLSLIFSGKSVESVESVGSVEIVLPADEAQAELSLSEGQRLIALEKIPGDFADELRFELVEVGCKAISSSVAVLLALALEGGRNGQA